MRLVNLTGRRLEAFEHLKTTEEMRAHGPLALGKPVEVHKHTKPALYLVRGKAILTPLGAMLGKDCENNAVVVEPGDLHGWESLQEGTIIEHVFGELPVQQVLAAA